MLSERLILGFGINLGPSATGGSDMKSLICEDDKLCVLLILHRCTAPLLVLTKSLKPRRIQIASQNGIETDVFDAKAVN